MLEPGKAAKTDKSSIITDAIRIVTQLRAENGQLRQLNKFLEVCGMLVARHASACILCTLVPACTSVMSDPCPEMTVEFVFLEDWPCKDWHTPCRSE